ncbi:MAG: hypothetical protein HGN29_06715 [Asgard group archaeon]|nr:hypothetical protein [Asgard group archaeon]
MFSSYGPIELDPGGGGGGGGGDPPPTYYYRTLLSLNPDPDLGDPQTTDTEDIYSQWNWHIHNPTTDDKTEFLQAIDDSDSMTTNKLAISYVGHGDIEDEEPYLKLPDESKVKYSDLDDLSTEKSYWHLRFVLMTGCHSMDNDRLADGFHKLGAEVVIGGIGDASVALSKAVANIFYYYALTEHYSVEEAFTFVEQDYDEASDNADTVNQEVMDDVFGGSVDNLIDSLADDFWGTEEDITSYLISIYPTWAITLTMIAALIIILILLFPILILPWFFSSLPDFPYRMKDYNTDTLTYI